MLTPCPGVRSGRHRVESRLGGRPLEGDRPLHRTELAAIEAGSAVMQILVPTGVGSPKADGRHGGGRRLGLRREVGRLLRSQTRIGVGVHLLEP